MEPKLDNNELRALSGGILLILSVTCIITGNTNSNMEIILTALASFLVGGAFLSNKQ